MKKRVIMIAVGVAALILVIYLNMYMKGTDMPDYSVFSTNDKGASLLYDTLKELGYPVDISYRRIDSNTDINDIYIIFEPNWQYLSSDDVKAVEDWVMSGGSLLYLGSLENSFYGMIVKYQVYPFGSFGYSSVGLGEIVVGRSDGLINLDIMSQKSTAYDLAKLLYDESETKIYFCEYYHGFRQSPTVWYTMPTVYKAVVAQCILITVLIVWMLGKRFGKPVPYYEDIERDETEYLSALANVYRSAGMGNAVIDYFYEEFLRKCAAYFGISMRSVHDELEDRWKNANLKCYELLLSVRTEVNKQFDTKKRRGAADCMKVLADISKLQNVLRDA